MIIEDNIIFLYVDHHDSVYKEAPKVLGDIDTNSWPVGCHVTGFETPFMNMYFISLNFADKFIMKDSDNQQEVFR